MAAELLIESEIHTYWNFCKSWNYPFFLRLSIWKGGSRRPSTKKRDDVEIGSLTSSVVPKSPGTATENPYSLFGC